MATNIRDVAPYDTFAHFDRIAALIQQTFNVPIEQLIKRRDTLCQEVAQLRDDFHNKESARVAAIEELERTQQQMQQMGLKSNINLPVQEQAVIMFQEAKQHLCVPTPLPNLSFSCPTLSLLQSQIEQFGEVVQLKVPHYSEKKQPILTAGKKHNETCEVRLDASSLESETGSESLTYYNRSEFETATEEPSPMEKCRFCHREYESAVTKAHMEEECLLNPEVAKDLPEEMSLLYATCITSPDSSYDSDTEQVACDYCGEEFSAALIMEHNETCENYPHASSLKSEIGSGPPTYYSSSEYERVPKTEAIKSSPGYIEVVPFPLTLPPPFPSRKTERIKCYICRKEILMEEMPSHVEECRNKEGGWC